MNLNKFFERLKVRCREYVKDGAEGCNACGMQRFCYTAPASMTGEIIGEAIDRLSRKDRKNREGAMQA